MSFTEEIYEQIMTIFATKSPSDSIKTAHVFIKTCDSSFYGSVDQEIIRWFKDFLTKIIVDFSQFHAESLVDAKLVSLGKRMKIFNIFTQAVSQDSIESDLMEESDSLNASSVNSGIKLRRESTVAEVCLIFTEYI